MKIVAFTLDALFALIMTSMAIALLLYFSYVPQSPYLSSFTEAQGILNTLLSSNASAVADSNPTVAAMVNQNLASGEQAPQYIYYMGGNARGPLGPTISTIFQVGSPVSTPVVAGYGDVFFGAGNVLYAFNASGPLAWSYNAITKVMGAPVLYNGWVIFANTVNITAINAHNGEIVWSTNAIWNNGGSELSAPLLEYGGRIIAGTSSTSNNIYSIHANNGSIAWSINQGGFLPDSFAIADGSLLAMSSSGVLALYDNSGLADTTNMIWSSDLTPLGSITKMISTGNIIAYGVDGCDAGASCYNETSIDGNVYYSYAIPASLDYDIQGVGYYGPYIVYQSADQVSMIKSTRAVAWTNQFYTGSDATVEYNTTPAVSATTVYTIWGTNVLRAQNLSTGKLLWQTNIPYGPLSYNLTLAYGRLYVTAGDMVIGYGACNANPNYPILSVAQTLYLNGDGSCADALLNGVSPMANYSVFGSSRTQNAFWLLPTNDIASFNGQSSTIETGAGYGAQPEVTISFWMDAAGFSSNTQIPFDSSPAGLWRVSVLPSNNFMIDPGSHANILVLRSSNLQPYNVMYNSWQMITLTAQDNNLNTAYKFYVNGTLINSSSVIGSTISAVNALVFGGASYNGMLADVQIYSTALSPQKVAQLYREGIQGGPLGNAGVEAWYPLDGDANDYVNASGSGYPYNVVYKAADYLPKGLVNAYEIDKASALVPARNYSGAGNFGLYNVGVLAWR